MWQRLQWKAEQPASLWEGCAAPLWNHPSLPALQRLRRVRAAGAMALAEAGVRSVGDMWDAGKREWRAPDEVLSRVPRGSRAQAGETLQAIFNQVSEWLDFDDYSRSWWWDMTHSRGARGNISLPLLARRRHIWGV